MPLLVRSSSEPLLPQPGGFEGVGLVTKAVDADYETVPKRVDVGDFGIELDAISPTYAPPLNRQGSPVRGPPGD